MSPRPRRHKLAEYLQFATELAEEAGKVTLHYFRKGVDVEAKSDDTPVTVADRDAERLIRDAITDKYKDHGILGEEHGEINAGARWRWIIDPIDGTRSFIHGVPLYTTLIGIECNGEMVGGVIHCPPLNETVAAAVGYGCTYNGEPCQVSTVDDISKARLNVTDYGDFMRRNPNFATELLHKVHLARGWADAYAYLLVATGRAEIALDPIVSLWDIAPLKPIITEAGGVYTDFYGNTNANMPTALATNGLLHDTLLELARLDRSQPGE